MFSYKERLATFSHWPETHQQLTKHLAIMGQYSTSKDSLATACVFCKAAFPEWSLDDRPLTVHFQQNTMKCPLFKLQYVTGRKALVTELSDEVDKYIDRKFIQVKIAERAQFFCMRCGATSLTHECDGKVQKLTENTDLNSAQFYIKYLSGKYIEQADAYIREEVELKAEQTKLLDYLLSIEKKPICGLETFESFLERSSERIFEELEKRMKSMESNAVEQMYNESMIL